eukprot:5193671-Amphidinium_carterae.1
MPTRSEIGLVSLPLPGFGCNVVTVPHSAGNFSELSNSVSNVAKRSWKTCGKRLQVLGDQPSPPTALFKGYVQHASYICWPCNKGSGGAEITSSAG